MKTIYAPEALSELREAIDWYDRQRDGLGAEFYDEILAAVEMISADPLRFAIYEGTSLDEPVRRALVKRFPYVVSFKIIGNEIRILSIFHGRRRPGYWKDL